MLMCRRGELMPERRRMSIVDVQERRVDAREEEDYHWQELPQV